MSDEQCEIGPRLHDGVEHAMIPISDRPTLHALLVGIDAYPQPPDSAGTAVPSLRGCVRDVERLRDHLALAGVPASRIATLTATAATDSQPPTRQALIDALLALLVRAEPGEQVLIHYSGHGTRLKTAFGDDKRGGATHDEALVPWDAPSSSAALLRDVELAFLLKRFVEKEVFVTLVLDCCHSGGAVMRGEGDERLARSLDGAVRPLGDGLASREELIEAWRWWWEPPVDPDAPRDFVPNWETGDSGWLPVPRGYALLAACTHDQLAHEIDPGDGGRTGLLTHSLLQVLEAAPATLTYKQLYQRLCSAFTASGKTQTPQVEGEIEREMFGGALRPTAWALRVVARQGTELELDGGVAHGLRVGARVRVRDPAGPGAELAAVLTRVGAVDSTASIVLDRAAQAEEPGADLGPGAEVLIDDPGDPSLTVVVALRFTGLGGAEREALQAVGTAAAAQGSAFLRAAGTGESADLVVTVADGCFVVLDATGEPLPMLPPLPAATTQTPRLAARLDHYARYRNVERLRNEFAWSSLAGRLELEIGSLPEDFDLQRDRPQPQPLPQVDGVYQVRVGDWACLTLCNRSRQDLYLALFDLRPDWSIEQALPTPWSGDSYVLPASPKERRPVHLPVRPDLPPGVAAGRDVLKVFAATRSTRFNWLTLPPLDERHRDAVAAPATPLETLMARWGGEPHRDFQLGVPSGDEWTTVQVESWMTRR